MNRLRRHRKCKVIRRYRTRFRSFGHVRHSITPKAIHLELRCYRCRPLYRDTRCLINYNRNIFCRFTQRSDGQGRQHPLC